MRADGLGKVFRVLAIGTGVLAAVAAHRQRDVGEARTEFFVLILVAVAGACFTAAANNLAMLYLAVETLSIGGYLLAGFKKDDPRLPPGRPTPRSSRPLVRPPRRPRSWWPS